MSYHHGDLRNGLLSAALRLLRDEGIEAVSLRAVARQAGVSHAAPYHHFADKAALMEALAQRGFEDLAVALRTGMAQAGPDSLHRFQAAGLAYGEFAFANPALFRLLGRSGLRQGASVAAAAAEAYQVLEDGVVACQRDGSMQSGDPAPLANTAWAAVHGAVLLVLDGLLEAPSARARHQLLSQVTTVLGAGFVPRQ